MKDIKTEIEKKVNETPFIDTHEHLIDENERLNCLKPIIPFDDWTLLLNHYFKFDLISCGITKTEIADLFSNRINPIDKWKIIKKYWLYVKNTTSGIVFQKTIKKLYHVNEISDNNIAEIQFGYEQNRTKGFYKYIIHEVSNIKYCQVHSPIKVYRESESHKLLRHDIGLNGLIQVSLNEYSVPENYYIKTLSDWHRLIDLWLDENYKLASGVKIGNAYFRRLDFKKVVAEDVEDIFIKKITNQHIVAEEEKKLQDHLFWYSVDKATKYSLPVKIHTGQWAMNNIMNMEWVRKNPSDCASLCKASPETKFIFFHISYPHYEEMLSLAKHFSNAYIDMCWAWSINPLAAKDFLKKFILTAPNNKIFTFGGDEIIVENIVGHSIIARKGIIQALSELVSDKWIKSDYALEIIESLMYKNVERIF